MSWLTSIISPKSNLAATKPAPLPARKAGKATSYTAKGPNNINVAPPPASGSEIGSSLGVPIRELVPELVSPLQRRLVYAAMQNEAAVDVSMRAIKTPVLGAEYYMDPFSEDPLDMTVSQFVWDNLSGGMAAPFINSIEDILHMFEDGKSVLEPVFEERSWSPGETGANSKMYTMLKKLGVRPESSISTINYDDNGGPLEIIHNAIRADGSTEEVTIPITKAMIFTFNRRGGRVDGKSILRSAYPHWYYKNHLYKVDAIQKERHGIGVPKGKLLPGFNPRDVAIMTQMLRNLRANEESFMLLTPNVDVEFAELKGNLVNVLESIDHHNMMIMLNVMAQFLLATSSSGARANAATQVDMFMKALKYIANYIADVFNMYLIPQLVVWNFPTTNFPKLCVRNIGEAKDLQMLASAFGNLFAQGALTPDIDTENRLRKVFDLPAKQPGAISTAPAQPVDPTANGKAQKGAVKPGADKSGNIGKSPSSAYSSNDDEVDL